ncbi:uncharacterized protein LOC125312443 isoform X2 [Rhodamnia argentea]|uniref:Uncharacterized protein LOC125312443 isoform X2 n=1 Tax=Rhodamnia argentea TaxID=178133 RepID=A0ABM3GTF3_9MYRT|nr:uncharacterized protein LOC125312443 isoform X2 [Rhodamnia argentea]
MESNVMRDAVEIEEEYVLLDLDSVSEQFDILPNAPYVLSGLDTLSPILVIDNKLKLVQNIVAWIVVVKLIGHYEETIGTCIALTEEDTSPIVPEEIGPSEVNKSSGRCNMNPNLCPSKQVKPVACIDKILKFKLLVDTNVPDASAQP